VILPPLAFPGLWLYILSTCHYFNLLFCQDVILSTCLFINLPFCQLAILSTCNFATCHLVKISYSKLNPKYSMDKLKLTVQNLGQVFNSSHGCACACQTIQLITETAKLNVENSSRTTFRLSPISFRALRIFHHLPTSDII
jgi:hypothetical protein